ncbi:DUF2868 domain-containing protein [Reinekea sp.]|jgi:hypothetical protein|uniref:DUF2868 domain-containing protein n=1 Tax=Reinekea sp. TaxID=1970455 RepID=UPI002A8197DC|nr:DUF2868 domain-containing protein [Reinekea sp.]
MVYSTEDRAVQRFFLRQGLTQGVLRWVSFRTFLATAGWQDRFSAGHLAVKPELSAQLAHWQQLDRGIEQQRGFYWLMNGLAVLLGALSMAAALTATGPGPINLWLVFTLFAFAPLFMTLISAASLFRPVSAANVAHSPVLRSLIHRAGFAPALVGHGRILAQWARWQLQSFSLLLLISALATFFLLATFQDLSFGWSSTLIEEDQTMARLVHLLTYPWHWLAAAPSEQLIAASRYYQGVPLASGGQPEPWWPTLVGAMLCYGLIPRLILALGLRARLVLSLKRELVTSGEVERLLNGSPSQVSTEPLPRPSAEASNCATIALPSTQYSLVGWQLPTTLPELVHNLGLASWAEDEHWLDGGARELSLPLLVLVQVHQTPTGELADCLELLGNPGHHTTLGVLTGSGASDRTEAQFRSWRFFAQQQRVALVRVMGEAHD